jgi:Phosphodiester glycosidase
LAHGILRKKLPSSGISRRSQHRLAAVHAGKYAISGAFPIQLVRAAPYGWRSDFIVEGDMKRKLAVLVVITLASSAALMHVFGLNPLVKFGGVFWLPATPEHPWVPDSMALAMRDPPPVATSGPADWREIAAGFEVAELPVVADGREADRILLARIDSTRFRLVVRNAPRGDKHLDDWMADLGATLVVNGSFYASDGTPATPVVSNGTALGPTSYDSKHGAFVSVAGKASIRDLRSDDWHTVLQGADDAMVSYPLLIASDGSTSRVPRGSGWLANRSFLGQDQAGRIIIGTTRGAFFSLDRLAEFLKQAPLDLAIALNLDGGPVACQGIKLKDFRRRYCGRWEMQVQSGRRRMVPPWPVGTSPMPIALAVFPRP